MVRVETALRFTTKPNGEGMALVMAGSITDCGVVVEMHQTFCGNYVKSGLGM